MAQAWSVVCCCKGLEPKGRAFYGLAIAYVLQRYADLILYCFSVTRAWNGDTPWMLQ